MGWVVGGAAAESLACPCRKEGWVHQDLASSDAHVLFTRGLEPSVTFWAFPVRAHLQPRWGSSSHQVVVQELSLILPVACNRRKMCRSWKSVLRLGFPRHAAESSLCSPCVWLESASLTLKPPAAKAFADGPSSHLHTHTCCTHRIKENCEPFLSVLSCGWRTIQLRCRLVKIVFRGLLSKTVHLLLVYRATAWGHTVTLPSVWAPRFSVGRQLPTLECECECNTESLGSLLSILHNSGGKPF